VKAILCDIHGNLEALHAVLDDAAREGATEIYCLGDLVGYGPFPRECIELAMRWKVVVLGNHDKAVRCDPPGVGPSARAATQSLIWSRAQLDASLPNAAAAERRRAFLEGLPRLHVEGDFQFVHATPRRPLHDYLFPHHADDAKVMEQVFATVGRYCFGGHTHIPGLFTEGGRFARPEEIGYAHKFNGRKALVNVGSVGQPRDGDWRACYTLLDGDTIRFRRVEYDVEATIRAIRDIEELGEFRTFLGNRLRDGD
jgi:diadenosine tetraphosphatase ApaH/serine/threonine PP2A family protein phosphatase